MTREPTAIIQGLDKVAARVSRFEAPVGHAVHYGKLLVLVRDCERSAPEDRPENAAFLEIYEERPGEAKERLFAGWMFSSSPALSALEHPVYDVTLLECKGGRPGGVRAGSGRFFDRQTRRQVADESRPLTQRLGQQAVIAGAADLDSAELRQMRRHELRVEQPEIPEPQPRHEMHQRDLAGVGDPAEHALAKKRRAQRDPVKPADQLAVVPAFDAMRRPDG